MIFSLGTPAFQIACDSVVDRHLQRTRGRGSVKGRIGAHGGTALALDVWNRIVIVHHMEMINVLSRPRDVTLLPVGFGGLACEGNVHVISKTLTKLLQELHEVLRVRRAVATSILHLPELLASNLDRIGSWLGAWKFPIEVDTREAMLRQKRLGTGDELLPRLRGSHHLGEVTGWEIPASDGRNDLGTLAH